MDNEVKQRNRRRKRAQRMQAQRANKVKDGDSAEDESPIREKPVRPPMRRKKSKEPLIEEDIIDGFAILGFRTFEDLEGEKMLSTTLLDKMPPLLHSHEKSIFKTTAIALATSGVKLTAKTTASEKRNSVVPSVANIDEKPKVDTGQRHSSASHHISHPPSHNLLLAHGDAGTSDDSGRASERLTGSSVAPRDPDSSRDRLSDASSRCSSGKGYICDSEGEDDKGSDAGSVLFASTPTPQRKHEFPGTGGLPSGIPGGDESASPVPAPTSPCLAPPAPSPAPAALPPHSALPQPPYSSNSPMTTSHVIAAATTDHPTQKSSPPSPPTAATGGIITSATINSHHTASIPPQATLPSNPPSIPQPQQQQPVPHPQTPTHLQQSLPPPPPTSHNQIPHAPSHSHLQPQHPVSAVVPSPVVHSQHLSHPSPPTLSSSATSLSSSITTSTIGGSNNIISHHPQSMPPSNQMIPPSHIGPGHATTLLNHQIPPSLSVSSNNQQQPLPQPPIQHAHNNTHTPSHHNTNSSNNCISSSSSHHSIVNHVLTSASNHPPNSLSNHPPNSLSNHPPNSLSNHPPMLPVSRAAAAAAAIATPPPPMSAATPPASLPAALPQSASAPSLIAPPSQPPTQQHHHHHHPHHEVQSQREQQKLTPHNSTTNVPTSSAPNVPAPPPPQILAAPLPPPPATYLSNGPVSNGIGAYHHPPQQAPSTFPAYPPLYAPYAASLRNSIAVTSPSSSMMQHSSGRPPVVPTLPSPTITSQTQNLSTTSSVNSLHLPPAAITSSHNRELSAAALQNNRGTHSPRGHSPNRERDSYSSNVSSLSRGSVTPVSIPYSSTSVSVTSSSLSSSSTLAFSKAAVWSSSSTGGVMPQSGGVPPSVGSQLSPAPPRPTPPPVSAAAGAPSVPPSMHHSFPAPMFAPPLAPPPVSTASPLSLQTNPNPFSADSLFQSNQADMLRRELDNRFLASQDRTLSSATVGGVVPGVPGAPSYLRTEMHQHQHHHTHVHQHAAPILPPPPAPPAVVPPPSLFPPPLFKDIPKMGSVDSPFYRQNMGLSSYPGYSPGLLHPGLGGPTPFVPPNHLPAFQPKQPLGESTKPKVMKTGKWNAMHVRVAWEIYHHQQKQQADLKPGSVGAKSELLRPPSHVFPGGLVHHPSRPPHELPFHRGPPFDTAPHPGSLFAAPPTHLGGVSPFSRYGSAFPNPAAFGMSPYPTPGRELPPLGLHDPWRSVSALQRTVTGYPGPTGPWGLKPDPVALERREQEERERERIRRERERERERERKQQLEQQERERERERERREKERREMERRELERLHQQRLAESKAAAAAAAAAAARDRSPLRNGNTDDIRVKEEPRPKDDDVVMLSRSDPRYHPYLRHPNNMVPPPPRGMMPPGLGGPPQLPPHFPPPPTNAWPPPSADPFRDPYRFDPLRYNPLMEAMRAEEERVKMYGAYANPHLRQSTKEAQAMLHMRAAAGPPGGPQPPPPHLTSSQAKDDSSQSR